MFIQVYNLDPRFRTASSAVQHNNEIIEAGRGDDGHYYPFGC